MSSWGSAQAQTSPGTPKDGHLCPSLPKRIVRVASHEPGRRPGAVALQVERDSFKGPVTAMLCDAVPLTVLCAHCFKVSFQECFMLIFR